MKPIAILFAAVAIFTASTLARPSERYEDRASAIAQDAIESSQLKFEVSDHEDRIAELERRLKE